MSSKVAVVTGSNKGLGLAIVKGLCKRFDGIVYLTSRDEARGKEAVVELNKLGLYPKFHQLDVADKKSVKDFGEYLKKTHGGIDILVNNAAVANSDDFYNDYEFQKNVIDINYYSILNMQEFIFPLVKNNGRILNISSDCGHLSNLRNKYWIQRLSRKDLTLNDVNEFVEWYLESVKNGTFNPDDIVDKATVAAYRISKIAVSAFTILQQKAMAAKNISVNSMHPGLIRTGMTGNRGFLSADQAAETPIFLVLDAPQDLKGAYVWYDRKVLDWYDTTADYYFKVETLDKDYGV